MEWSFTSVCIVLYSVFIVHASSFITSLSPDQLAQLHQQPISKQHKTELITNPLLKPDENAYDKMTLSKRDAGLNSISVVDLVQDAMSFEQSKKTVRSPKKSDKARDIILEIVKKMIQREKTRRRFDLVNPPNSKYTKKQQLLWDRLRIKAAEEMLLHPQPVFQRATERIFNNFKMDLAEEDQEVTLGPVLFQDLKNKVEKQFYMDQYATSRPYISTLKPVY